MGGYGNNITTIYAGDTVKNMSGQTDGLFQTSFFHTVVLCVVFRQILSGFDVIAVCCDASDRKISRNVIWITFQTIAECGLDQICQNHIIVVFCCPDFPRKQCGHANKSSESSPYDGAADGGCVGALRFVGRLNVLRLMSSWASGEQPQLIYFLFCMSSMELLDILLKGVLTTSYPRITQNVSLHHTSEDAAVGSVTAQVCLTCGL